MNAVTKATAFPASVQPGIPVLSPPPIGWSQEPLGRYLEEVRRPVTLRDEEEYELVTAKRARGGIVHRERLKGRDISVKSQFRLEEGDFLISKRQIVHGACGLVPRDLEGAIVSNEYAVLRCNAGLDPRFLSYLTHTIYFQQTCFHSSIGVHVEKMIFKLERWLEWNFNLPPLAEQRRIADILETWDRSIGKAKELLSNAEEQKRALTQQLLSGRRRLPPFASRPWRVVPIRNIAEEASERNRSRQNLPVISCSKTVGFVNSLEYFKKKVFSDDLSSYKIIHRNQLGYPSNHIEEGSIGHQLLHDVALVSPIYTVFSVTPQMRASFLFKVLKTDKYRQIFSAATNASVDRRGSLRWAAFSSIKVPAPELDEQQAIDDVLNAAGEEVKVLQTLVKQLEMEKSALMQQLLTGKRRVTA